MTDWLADVFDPKGLLMEMLALGVMLGLVLGSLVFSIGYMQHIGWIDGSRCVCCCQEADHGDR